MIIVTGSVTARPDGFAALRDAAIAHCRRSRLEDGCISHAVHVDAEDPLRLFFYERWRDMAALKVHFAQAGTATALAAMREYAAHSEPIAMYEADEVAR